MRILLRAVNGLWVLAKAAGQDQGAFSLDNTREGPHPSLTSCSHTCMSACPALPHRWALGGSPSTAMPPVLLDLCLQSRWQRMGGGMHPGKGNTLIRQCGYLWRSKSVCLSVALSVCLSPVFQTALRSLTSGHCTETKQLEVETKV